MPEEDFEEVQLVVFMLGKEEFGVDITQVREILKIPRITSIPNSPEFIEGVINLRGQITTVMDLRKRLGVGGGEISENTRIVIVEVGDTTIGMVVDSVSEVLRLSTKDIDAAPSIATDIEAEYIQGVGKLTDRLLILLDLGKILSRGEMEQVKKLKVKSRR
ncbi:MAG: chemotaxis protein CheW [Candidatus Hydrothermarchaeales archaeon]